MINRTMFFQSKTSIKLYDLGEINTHVFQITFMYSRSQDKYSCISHRIINPHVFQIT